MNRIACHLVRLAAFALLLHGSSVPAAQGSSAEAPVAVIYPHVREPYRSAFLSIAGGLSETLGARAQVQEVEPTETAQDISARVAAREAATVVLLGKYGLDVAQQLDPKIDRVVGAVLVRPAELPVGVRGISMLPAPRSLFAKLHELAPSATRIAVVHGGDDNDWLIERAAADAAALGYTFEPTRRETLRDGANAYRDLLARLQSPQDALWLPPASPFLAESSVLQMILREAWDRNIVVFSSTGAHVPKGALFALVPDNAEMGRALGRLAAAAPPARAELQLLEQLDTAINIRTANHLGLGLDAADKRFDLVFPSR